MPELQDIHRLQAFVTAVEEGSFTAAVKKLHITQPALSARLKLLEEGLECQLLERTGRGVRPTPMGLLVYKNATDILARMRHLGRVVKNHLELRDGWLHLGGGATAVMGVFPNAIASFREQFPNIQFTLHEQDSKGVLDAVRNELIDVGIVTREPDASLDNPRQPYALLNGVLPEKLDKGTLTAKTCYDKDFIEQSNKVGNYIQRTNNFRHAAPDNCSAPLTEMVNSFYLNP
jgi:DNA-binding transcriptional LysR family regulator